MNFQSKLLLVYLFFILVLVITLGVVFFVSSANTLEKNAYTNLDVLVDKMSLQLDNLIRPMDFISLNLLSNGKFMSSMKTLVAIDRSKTENQGFINDAYMEVNRALQNYSISRDYYAINMFNSAGDFFSSRFDFNKERIEYKKFIENMKWTDVVRQNNGKIIIIPPNYDLWDNGANRVFSVARTVRGTDFNVGYIQVQELYENLEKSFYTEEDSRISIVALTRENEVLYSNGIGNQLLFDFYCDIAQEGEIEPTSIAIPEHSSDQIITVAISDYTGIHILLAQDRQVLMQPLSVIKTTTLLAAAAIIALSYIYMQIFSRYLTRPLRQLKKEIEQTQFKNLLYKTNLPNSFNDEIKSLNAAFIKLRERLNDSINQEIKSRNLYLQASLESLQARVNPHFIYNILNVLSNRGMMHGDSVICNTCKSIASMLRYSTSTADLSASLADELDHVENYLSIMKTRFEHRLDYIIDVDPDILMIKIPKITLQPLVENSLNHGFVDVDKIMKISIHGYKCGNRWVIEVRDNGQGFNPYKLQRLNQKIKDAHAKNMVAESGEGIGGMGILNLYSRLILYFDKSDFDFILCNEPKGGACVTLSNSLSFEEVS